MKLREVREKSGKTQAEVAEYLNISRQGYNNYELGNREPSKENWLKLARLFNVSVDFLMSDDDTKLPEGAIPVDVSTFIKIPVYGEVSAGTGCFAENHIIGYEYISPDSISQYEEYFFLKVKGDSMEPQICNGDYALIQKQTSIDSGSIAVVIIDNEDGVIKKVNYGSDWIELVSFNPYYPPRRFEGADVQRISVVGLVKEIKRKF